MIPRTYPSTYASNGQQQLVGFYLGSVTGLTKWVDYIPVRLGQTAPGTENTYNTDGYIPVASLSSVAGLVAFKDYVPLYIDNSATDAWTTNIAGYIPTGLSGFGGASLGLDFTTSSTLDPRITFTRASNATVTKSDGTIGYAPHNLLTYSEQFDNSSWWGKAAGTVAANVATAPDGTVTADQIASTGGGVFRGSITVSQGVLHTASVYVKAVSGGGLFLFGFDTNPSNGRASFNLSTGAVSNLGVNVVSASAEALADGWYRCTVSAITTSTTCTLIYYNATSGANWLIWGAQLNVGALQPYYPTTVKNLLGYTQEFDNAAWTKSNSTVTANATTAPDGSLTADKLVESGSGSVAHYVGQGVITTIVGTKYTLSYYAKAGERNWVQLSGASAQFGSAQWANFDLVNGVVGNKGTTQENETITDVGNGWYRCSITITATVASSTTTGYLLVLSANSASRFPAYEAEAGKGVFIWGAQLSDSASLDQYVYNPGAAPSAAAYYGPRFDYDPVTLAPKGLLIEEQRTNLCLQSQAISTSPWAYNGSETCVPSTLIDPAGGLSAFKINLGGATFERWQQPITTVVSTVYTLSAWVRSTSGTTQFRLRFTGGVTSPDLTATTTWQRFVFTTTANTTAGTFAFNTPSAGGPTEIHVWGAQLEAGAFATSYIPTTTATVTRAADVAVMTGANFSNWYNQSEGTLFAEAITFAPTSSFDGVVYVNTSANAPVIGAGRNGTNSRAFGASVSIDQGSNTYPVSVTVKQAIAAKVNDFALSTNGSAVATDTATDPIPTADNIVIGNTGTGAAGHLNGHIRKIAYYPRRLANVELQAITV